LDRFLFVHVVQDFEKEGSINCLGNVNYTKISYIYLVKCKYLLLSILTLVFCTRAAAQNILLDHSYTAQQLVETILDTDCEVQISNATITGYNGSQGQSYAYFSLNYPTDNNWPFTDGIVLSSGYTASMITPDFDTASSDGTTSWGGDADIADAVGNSPAYNATYLEFDFVSSLNYVQFKYFLTSEEFFSAVLDDARDCSFNDGVALLIKPADGSEPYTNLATFGLGIPVCTANISYDNNCPYGVQNWSLLEATNYYYSFSYGGETVVMTAVATIEPGITYHVKIGVADGKDAGYDAAIIVGAVNPTYTINLGEDRLLSGNNPLCDGEALTLTSLPAAVQYKWYKNNTLIAGETAATYSVTQPGVYKSVATLQSGCDYTGTITIEYGPAISQAPLTYYQCDEDGDGLSGYYIPLVGEQLLPPGLTPLYYYHSLAEANSSVNALQITAPPTIYYNTVPNEPLYVRVQNTYGCQAVIPIILSTTVPVNVALNPLLACPAQNEPVGFAAFNLQQAAQDIAAGFPDGTTVAFFADEATALLGSNPLPAVYQNTVAGNQTLYARLNTAQGCYGIGVQELIIEDFGGQFTNESLVLCPGGSLTLNAGSGFAAYSWDTDSLAVAQTIIVNQPGIYKVQVTAQSGCMRTKTFTVLSSGPPQSVAYKINEFNRNNNSLVILVTGIGQYEYSLDGMSYRPENVFENLSSGEYTVYIQDTNGCGPVLTDEVVILDYPTFFTPNGDGIEDTWRIPHMQHRPGLEVNIYDRYGRLITTLNGFSAGWDGTVAGNPLPATDYWFAINLENGRVIRGHFALIR
jgi:gliding motility-associated-like protein